MQWCNGYGLLVILVSITYITILYNWLIGKLISNGILNEWLKRKVFNQFTIRKKILKIIITILVLIGVIIFLIIDTNRSRYRLRSLIGIIILIGIGFVFSKHPKNVKFQSIFIGFILQFIFGFICIRWTIGRQIFQCIGDKLANFLDYSKFGADAVYGQFLVFEEGVFAFAVMPVIFFFSVCISILYYLELLQLIFEKLGWFIQTLLQSTPCESVVCSANIFVSMTETALLIRPFIKYLTKSQLHLVMTSGFATVSGSVLGIYTSYGADPAHLVTSSVMAAPAALAFSKLFYPELETTVDGDTEIEKSTDKSMIDAAVSGATNAIMVVLGIIANLVAFISFLAFLNSLVNWLGNNIGVENLTFVSLFTKLFIPLAWSIGISWQECEIVAEIIATKSIINEFVAYKLLGEFKSLGVLSPRSSAIATYACCGFANPGSIGILVGLMTIICPEKRDIIASLAFRAYISGNIICFLSASISGLLMD